MTLSDADVFRKKEYEENKRNAARKSVIKSSWRTGEEAGIGLTESQPLPMEAVDTFKSKQTVSDDEDGIPEDILSMFGE